MCMQIAKGSGPTNSSAAKFRRKLEKLHAYGSLALMPASAVIGHHTHASQNQTSSAHRGDMPGSTVASTAGAEALHGATRRKAIHYARGSSGDQTMTGKWLS